MVRERNGGIRQFHPVILVRQSDLVSSLIRYGDFADLSFAVGTAHFSPVSRPCVQAVHATMLGLERPVALNFLC